MAVFFSCMADCIAFERSQRSTSRRLESILETELDRVRGGLSSPETVTPTAGPLEKAVNRSFSDNPVELMKCILLMPLFIILNFAV